jgi:Fe-S-cluster-containing dehydrogenase component
VGRLENWWTHLQQSKLWVFFTDSTLCIGCKACEVACKQWNGLPADGMEWTGQSYDNTGHLSATTWRHVTFTEFVRRQRTTDHRRRTTDHRRPRPKKIQNPKSKIQNQ